jgi:TRAP-type C4-dicarboxylate transport system permease small subunit
MIALMDKVSRGLSKAVLIVSGLGLVALVCLLGWQVFARYVLGSSPPWSEQAALVVMIGFIALAASAGVREGFHIGMTMAVDALPPQGQKLATALSFGVIAIFGLALGIYGGELVSKTWEHKIPSLGLPRGAAYLPLAMSGWLMMFFAIEQAIAALTNGKVEPIWN